MSQIIVFNENKYESRYFRRIEALALQPENYLRFCSVKSLRLRSAAERLMWPYRLRITAFDAAFVSKFPKHEIGQMAVNSLRRFGVDTEFIARGGDRLGIYYCEKGASQRPARLYTTARAAQSPRPIKRTLIGIKFLRALTGFILRA